MKKKKIEKVRPEFAQRLMATMHTATAKRKKNDNREVRISTDLDKNEYGICPHYGHKITYSFLETMCDSCLLKGISWVSSEHRKLFVECNEHGG